MSVPEDKELYCCNYCTAVRICKYAWDEYNKWQTVEKAKTEHCLAAK